LWRSRPRAPSEDLRGRLGVLGVFLWTFWDLLEKKSPSWTVLHGALGQVYEVYGYWTIGEHGIPPFVHSHDLRKELDAVAEGVARDRVDS